MSDTSIFLPVAALALWTLTVLGLVPLRRFAAASKKKVTVEDFRFGESTRVPGEVSIPNRAWMNLLEAPVLFYVACMVVFAIGKVDQTIIAVAWAYVGLRIVHSLIHVTYNNVFHRLVAFALSNFVLIAMWVLLVIRLWPSASA